MNGMKLTSDQIYAELQARIDRLDRDLKALRRRKDYGRANVLGDQMIAYLDLQIWILTHEQKHTE